MKLNEFPYQGGPSSRDETFDDIRTNRAKLQRILKGSEIVTSWRDSAEKLWAWWEKGRKPIAGIIDRIAGDKATVSVLDYGSANGLLLRSLQEWSTHTIEPYGLDKRKERVRDAQKLFPGKESHFVHSVEDLESLQKTFDVVYWNAWDHLKLEKSKEIEFVKDLYSRVSPGGALVVGFYDHNVKDRQKRLARLVEAGFTVSGTEEGPNETFVWFSVPGNPSP
ncbi:class I SAM-dependent methyltransferase [Patescibacteria group bacterium]|nr:class I SAM-dependent methyltransferase [Patescibacteria group bacterium]